MELLHPYEQLMYDRFAQNIQSWDLQTYSDITMLSFDFRTGWSFDDEGRGLSLQGIVHLGFKTLSAAMADVSRAESLSEALYRPGYGLSVSQIHVPNTSAEMNHDFALRDSWCEANGIKPIDKDEADRPEYDENLLDPLVVQACRRVAHQLHETGVLIEKFGKPLPIVIHTSDYDEEAIAATRAANPPSLSQLYEEQMLGRTYAQIDAYNNLVVETKTKPPTDQAKLWADALESLCLNLSSPFAIHLRDLARTRHDVANELIAVGQAAVPILIALIERYSPVPERRPVRPDEETESSRKFFERMRAKNPDWPRIPTTPTPEGDLVSDAVRVLHEIGTAEDIDVDRICTILRHLFANAIDLSLHGGNVWRLAGLLHRFRPDRFPFAKNPFTNYRDFGLEKSSEGS